VSKLCARHAILVDPGLPASTSVSGEQPDGVLDVAVMN